MCICVCMFVCWCLSAGVTIGFEEPWYTVFEETASVEVCVGVVQGTLGSDITLTFNVTTQQAETDYAVGKCPHTMYG